MNELSKISVRECEFCKRKIRILSNETASIVSVQCKECFEENSDKPRIAGRRPSAIFSG